MRNSWFCQEPCALRNQEITGFITTSSPGRFSLALEVGQTRGRFDFFICAVFCVSSVVDCEQSTFPLNIRRVRRLSERVGTKNALSQKDTGARRVVGTWNVQVKSFSFPEMRLSPQFAFCFFLNSIYFPVWHYLATSWSYFIFCKSRSGGGRQKWEEDCSSESRLHPLRGNVKVDPRPSLAYSRFCLFKQRSSNNLVPRAFPLKNGWCGKRPWHRLITCPLVHPKILGVIN